MPEKAQTTLNAIIALLALIPGVATLSGVIAMPPSDKQVLEIAVGAASLVSAVVVFALSAPIARARARIALLAVIGSFLLGLASLFAFQYFYKTLTLEYSVDGSGRSITLPLSEGPLQRRYSQDLGPALTISTVGEPLRAEIESRNSSTPIFWSALLVVAQMGLTFSILLGLVRLVPATNNRTSEQG
jgi:hypothetical protein